MAEGVGCEELSLLARDMTLKYGFLGLPQGGAKGGVPFDPDAPVEQRRQRLADFAKAIAPLLRARVYVPMSDMGTNNQDIRHMLRVARVPLLRRELRGNRSGYYTARGVLAAARAAAAHIGQDWSGSRAAIEGFGKVGSSLARMLDEQGVHVVGVSTSRGALYHPGGLPVPRLLEASALGGSAFVESFPGAMRLPLSQLLELPCDFLFPCARHHSISLDNAPRINARVVAPGANSPCTSEAEDQLSRRGVLVVPDFAANCGGVLGGTMEFAGVPVPAIDAFLEGRLGRRIAGLLVAAERRQVSLREFAVSQALEGFQQVRSRQENPAWSQSVFRAGLGLHRRGWIPEALVGRLAMRYFDRLLR